MKIQIKNIGSIKDVDIELGNLTVITGDNQSGKSFLLKIIFTLIKTLKNFTSTIAASNGSFSDLDLQDQLKKSFEHNIQTTFGCSINNVFSNEIGEISIQFLTQELTFKIFNNKVIELIATDIHTLPFKDIILFDQPLILDYFKYINSTATNKYLHSSQFNQATVQLLSSLGSTRLDLYQKLISCCFEIYDLDSKLRVYPILEKIRKLMNGHFTYDDITQNIVYMLGNNKPKTIPILSTSSGAKVFGILQLILCLQDTENSLLLLDGLDNELHPEWKLKYAQILTEISKLGIPLMVSSTSPYTIHSLKQFNKDNYIKFYHGEITEDGSVLKDCSNDLDPIFTSFASPMAVLDLIE